MKKENPRPPVPNRRKGLAAKGRRGIPLVWVLVILLALAGCSFLSQPTGSGTTASSGSPTSPSGSAQTGTATTPSTSMTTTASPTTAATTGTTAPPATTGTSGTTAVPTTATTAPAGTTGTTPATTAPTTATTSTTPAQSVDLSKLSHTARGWSYNRTAEGDLFKDVRVTVPSSISTLIAPWPVIWQTRPTSRKTVYLTMDEGYEFETNTREILDTLAQKNVHAAFFITGSYLRSQPDLVRRMLREGHLVLNHTDKHPNLANLYAQSGAAAVMAEITGLEAAFKTVTGQSMPRLLRPPEGAYSERLLGLLKQNGYRSVFWSFAYRDWLTDAQPTQAEARRLILGELHDGSVMLLHAVSNTNVAILPQLIDDIRARGYQFGRLTDIP